MPKYNVIVTIIDEDREMIATEVQARHPILAAMEGLHEACDALGMMGSIEDLDLSLSLQVFDDHCKCRVIDVELNLEYEIVIRSAE